jgi:hypothetical protein
MMTQDILQAIDSQIATLRQERFRICRHSSAEEAPEDER